MKGLARKQRDWVSSWSWTIPIWRDGMRADTERPLLWGFHPIMSRHWAGHAARSAVRSEADIGELGDCEDIKRIVENNSSMEQPSQAAPERQTAQGD